MAKPITKSEHNRMTTSKKKKVQTPLQKLKKQLENAGISMQTLKELAEGTQIASRWHIDDVIGRARERKIRVSSAQAKDILGNIERKHDATIGINWDVIDSWIDMEGLTPTVFEWNGEEYPYTVISIKGNDFIVCSDELDTLVGDNLNDKEIMDIDAQVYFYVPEDILFGPEDTLIKYVIKNCK